MVSPFRHLMLGPKSNCTQLYFVLRFKIFQPEPYKEYCRQTDKWADRWSERTEEALCIEPDTHAILIR